MAAYCTKCFHLQVEEQFTYLEPSTSAADPDPILSQVKVMTSIVNDALLLLRPLYNVTQYFSRLNVDYFKVVTLEMERAVSGYLGDDVTTHTCTRLTASMT